MCLSKVFLSLFMNIYQISKKKKKEKEEIHYMFLSNKNSWFKIAWNYQRETILHRSFNKFRKT